MVEFCGSSCWKNGGKGTMEELLEGAELPKRGAEVTVRLACGTHVVLQRAHHCLGACGRNPAARVTHANGEETYFSAKEAKAVQEALSAQVLGITVRQGEAETGA
jgi:hypothetical protein